MLRFFRSSKTSVLAVVALLAGLTWFHALQYPEAQPSGRYGTMLFELSAGWLRNIPSATVWVAFFLTLLVAVMLISVNKKLQLIDKISYLPGLCYILLIGGVPMIHRLNPAAPAAVFLVIAFLQLIESFDSDRLSYRYFTAPMFISLACFCYQYMYVYMAAVWLACLLFRPGYWREWVFSILGFALPVFFAFCWFFLVEDNPGAMIEFFGNIFSVERIVPSLSASTLAFFGFGIILSVITFGHLMRYIRSKRIIVRNGYYFIILIALITFALAIIVPDTLPVLWYLMAFPLSFILSHYLATATVRRGTIALALFFVGVIAAQVIFIGDFF